MASKQPKIFVTPPTPSVSTSTSTSTVTIQPMSSQHYHLPTASPGLLVTSANTSVHLMGTGKLEFHDNTTVTSYDLVDSLSTILNLKERLETLEDMFGFVVRNTGLESRWDNLRELGMLAKEYENQLLNALTYEDAFNITLKARQNKIQYKLLEDDIKSKEAVWVKLSK